MIALNIQNETGQLEAVVLGIADSFGGTPRLEDCYDPKSREHIKAGTFPKQEALIAEMNSFHLILKKHGVKVYRPEEIEGLNQIFSRDITFVIDHKIVLPNIIEDRVDELKAIQSVLEEIATEQLVKMPQEARAEGGDVMPWNEYLFVGYSEDQDFEKYQVARTNREGVSFLKNAFPNRIIKAFELNKSDENPRENALHLDCCFQPIGKGQAILFEEAFKNAEDVAFIVDYFGEENIIRITRDEMYEMNSNVFSISPEIIVSEQGFVRLNNELRKRGFQVEEVAYAEIAKMEGLLRCSTMPLRRK
jgi:N-dimethylarginine dimethylaminohydrolase